MSAGYNLLVLIYSHIFCRTFVNILSKSTIGLMDILSLIGIPNASYFLLYICHFFSLS